MLIWFSSLQAEAALLTKMAFRPVSVTSTFHKRLATAMGKQHSKQQKVRHVVTVVDPKRAKAEREKAEDERIRGRESLFRRQVSHQETLHVCEHVQLSTKPFTFRL